MKKLIILAIVVFSFGMISNASALPTNLSVGDSFYVGLIEDGIPSSEALEVSYINNLITLAAGTGPVTIGTEDYDRTLSTLFAVLPDAELADAVKDESGNTEYDANGAQYVLGKYDGPNYGSVVWFSGSGFGNIVLPSNLDDYGLSHASFYNPGDTPPNEVPEPTTMLLFGTGLLGLAGVTRRRIKK